MIKENGYRAADRFTIAAQKLLAGELDPEFANDTSSVFFLTGYEMDANKWMAIADAAKKSQFDLVHLSYTRGRERSGPVLVSLFVERSGIIHTWSECDLWAPADSGPLLIMPRGLKMCVGFDGRALIWHAERPTPAIGEGIARASGRLRRAAAEVTDAELDGVIRSNDRMAA